MGATDFKQFLKKNLINKHSRRQSSVRYVHFGRLRQCMLLNEIQTMHFGVDFCQELGRILYRERLGREGGSSTCGFTPQMFSCFQQRGLHLAKSRSHKLHLVSKEGGRNHLSHSLLPACLFITGSWIWKPN